MKILITGAAGFIGSHLSEYLSRAGHTVTAIDSLSDFLYSAEDKIKNTQHFSELGINFSKVNIAFDVLEEYTEGVDVIVTEAAIPGLVKSWNNLDTYLESNVLGLGRLLDAARKAKVKRFIQISTSSVYGRNAECNEEGMTNPYSPYGVSKLAAENLARAYQENFGLPITILRYFSVYGPRQRPDMAYQKFIKAIIRGDSFTVYGDGRQARSNTYVDDIVKGTALATNLDLRIEGRTINLAGHEKVELLDAITAIEKIIGKKAIYKFEPARAGDQFVTKGDYRLAERVLGYRPEVKFENGISRQIEWEFSRED